jgi:pyruvate,water dikinase
MGLALKVRNFIKRMTSGGGPEEAPPAGSVEGLRTAFKARYQNFKLLLNANNKALEIMTEMEEAARGQGAFGMIYVRALCTRVSTSVFQVAKHLNELAPGKYEELYGRFKAIQKEINPFIHPKALPKGGSLVLALQEVDKHLADQVGGKAANLGEIRNRLHLNVPEGFVITAEGYQHFLEFNQLQPEIDRLLQATDVERLDQLHRLSTAIQQLIIRSPLPENLERDILEHYRQLEQKEGKGVTVAVRSSALGEDVTGMSFAGQYRSELNVSSENILRAYKDVVASKYGLTAMAYRMTRGIRDEDVAMCAGCFKMVDAVSGGVAYSRNPVSLRRDFMIINAVWGLPKSVVDGSTPSDLFVLSRGEPITILRKEIPVKGHKFVCYPSEGVCRMDVTGDESHLASLSDEQAIEIGRLALRLEGYYGSPQDMEWAVAKDGSIVVLQCRPLKQMEGVADIGVSKTSQVTEPGPVLLTGGVTASPGVGFGVVFVVKKDMDALQFPEGAVLVAAQSLPRWAALLSRASAVITEQGSMAGHLANVSREFGVPAIFGVRGATELLRNGQRVTVDADDARVYEGRVEVLLRKEPQTRNLMEGSPVLEALKGAARHIVPLNLLDPDSPHFAPRNCRTFHDITRFCHEKGVYEMFQFGKEHRFPERSAKQLLCDVPTQFWVINLDDGFRAEVTESCVSLENIVSIPMLALWQGINAVPWQGPPPVDSRGFMSVLMEATINPALDPSMGSPYAARNYFMVSKNFCSLQSRFGFHFSTVEALVGERAMENYISFQFKGGAANLQRRIYRARFVADLLEDYDFRMEVRQDAVFARLEGYEQLFMESRLRVLGYLTIHTRQLDMVMSDSQSVNHHRQRITEDLKKVVASPFSQPGPSLYSL